MSGHSSWPEWVYIGVVVALLCYVGAEAWNVERIVEHVPADAEIIKVTGQQWLWTFEHEDGTKEIGELFMIMLFYWMLFLEELTLSGFHQVRQENIQFSAENTVD